jgi:hypothetical protein
LSAPVRPIQFAFSLVFVFFLSYFSQYSSKGDWPGIANSSLCVVSSGLLPSHHGFSDDISDIPSCEPRYRLPRTF